MAELRQRVHRREGETTVSPVGVLFWFAATVIATCRRFAHKEILRDQNTSSKHIGLVAAGFTSRFGCHPAEKPWAERPAARCWPFNWAIEYKIPDSKLVAFWKEEKDAVQ
jgi:hypothetical protein